jgi:serine/threonine-protein kinase
MLNTKIKDYQIQSELGRGGMATVYLAHDSKFDTNVAIKVLNKEFVHNDNIRKRFLAEAKSMFKMSHPNIIKVNDLIEENDTVAFVMEYIEGETLKEYLDRKGKLKDDEIKTIFSQMLEAVGYVHKQNLVHRDIKPSNFMIDREGNVKLMDFGIAKTLDASSSEYTQTGTGMQMGTPMYMSPEQITETKSVTAQSDIYSLGVVLWQMVTGQKPYDTKTLSSFQLQTKIVNDALTQTNTTWDAVIQKCTQKDIGRRYIKCAEIAQAMNSGSVKVDSSDSTVVESNGANAKQDKPRSEIRLEERFQRDVEVDDKNTIVVNDSNNKLNLQQKKIEYPIISFLTPGILLHGLSGYVHIQRGYDFIPVALGYPIGTDSAANIFLVLGFLLFIKFNDMPLLHYLKKQPAKNTFLISGIISGAFLDWQLQSSFPFISYSNIILLSLISASLIIISLFVNNNNNEFK